MAIVQRVLTAESGFTDVDISRCNTAIKLQEELVRTNIPFELLFLQLSTESMEDLQSFLGGNTKALSKQCQGELQGTINGLKRMSEDLAMLKNPKVELGYVDILEDCSRKSGKATGKSYEEGSLMGGLWGKLGLVGRTLDVDRANEALKSAGYDNIANYDVAEDGIVSLRFYKPEPSQEFRLTWEMGEEEMEDLPECLDLYYFMSALMHGKGVGEVEKEVAHPGPALPPRDHEVERKPEAGKPAPAVPLREAPVPPPRPEVGAQDRPLPVPPGGKEVPVERSGLLGEITEGVKLKETGGPQKRPLPEKTGLLGEIESGKKLKETGGPRKGAPPPSAEGGDDLFSALNRALNERRGSIKPDESEDLGEGSDAEWDE